MDNNSLVVVIVILGSKYRLNNNDRLVLSGMITMYNTVFILSVCSYIILIQHYSVL